MNRKGLELPMNTIVIMVMVLFVLIGLGIFFFQQFEASKTQGFDQSQCVSICQTAKSVHASQLPTGLCIKDAAAKNYCSSCSTGTCSLDDNPTSPITLTCGLLDGDGDGIKDPKGLKC